MLRSERNALVLQLSLMVVLIMGIIFGLVVRSSLSLLEADAKTQADLIRKARNAR